VPSPTLEPATELPSPNSPVGPTTGSDDIESATTGVNAWPYIIALAALILVGAGYFVFTRKTRTNAPSSELPMLDGEPESVGEDD
jgi:hypothetical protein